MLDEEGERKGLGCSRQKPTEPPADISLEPRHASGSTEGVLPVERGLHRCGTGGEGGEEQTEKESGRVTGIWEQRRCLRMAGSWVF